MNVRASFRAKVRVGLALLLISCGKARSVSAPPARSASTGSSMSSALGAASAPQPNDEPMPDVEEACRRFATARVADGDTPTDKERKALHGCDAEAAYYGLDGAAVDYVRARHCAMTTRLVPGTPANADAGILLMIYANGLGVTKNYDVAMHFACELGGDLHGLAPLLEKLWQAKRSGQLARLDQCELVSSGYCDLLAERLAKAARESRLRTATANMPAREVGALQRAATHFFDSRVQREIEQSGPMSARRALSERSQLEAALTSLLEQLSDPSSTPEVSDYPNVETELATLARRISQCKVIADNEHTPGAVTRAGIRETQEQWLSLQKAFLALARAFRPQTKLELWRAVLFRTRLDQLRDLATGC